MPLPIPPIIPVTNLKKFVLVLNLKYWVTPSIIKGIWEIINNFRIVFVENWKFNIKKISNPIIIPEYIPTHLEHKGIVLYKNLKILFH